jgi:hypothetical protein
MSRVLRFTAAAVLALAVVAPAPAAPRPDEKSPLARVPASAPIVVHLRGVEGTKDRFLALLKKALPEVAPVVELYLDKALKEGEYTDGRKLRGLAKDGPDFFVFTQMPKGDDDDNIAFILAITKYEDFRDNVLKDDERKKLKPEAEGYEWADTESGKPVYFVNKKDYVVVTPSKDVAVSFTKKQKGIDERISKEQAARLLGDDVGVYVSMDAVNKEYADQIKLAKESATEGLKKLAEAAEANQRGAFEFMRKLIDPAFQAVEDSQGIVFTLSFRPGGLALHLETELRTGTPTARAFEGNKLSALKGLDGMPGGKMVYIGMESNKSIMGALSGFVFGAGVDPDGKEGKDAKAALEALLAAGPGARVDAFDIPLQSIQVAQYEDPAKAVEAQLRLIKSLGSGAAFSMGMLKDKPKVTPGAEKYHGIEFTRVELKWDLEKMLESSGGGAPLSDDAKKQLLEVLKKAMGDGQTTWIGTDRGKLVLQVAAKDWAAAKKLIDGTYSDSGNAGSVAAYRDVRKELPAEANVVALVDVVRYTDLALSLARPVIETMMPLKIPTAPADLAPTYSGGTVTLKSDRASLDGFLSAATVHQIYKTFVQPLMGGAGAAN